MMGELPSIHQLECFIIYGRVQNFSLAAKEANITQSAFSAQMKKLEETLGVELIQRSNRGSHITPAGAIFLPKAQEVVERLRSIVYETQEVARNAPVELNIAILRALGDVHMNRHISHFRKENPRLRVNVYEMEEGEIVQTLHEGTIDVASVYLVDEEAFKGLERVRFAKDEIVFYAPHLHPEGKTASCEWVASCPLVLYPAGSSMSKAMRNYLHHPLHAVARLSTPYAMQYFCQENPAGALLPRRLLKALGVEQDMYALDPPLYLKVALLYMAENPKMHDVHTYVEHIRQFFAAKKA